MVGRTWIIYTPNEEIIRKDMIFLLQVVWLPRGKAGAGIRVSYTTTLTGPPHSGKAAHGSSKVGNSTHFQGTPARLLPPQGSWQATATN